MFTGAWDWGRHVARSLVSCSLHGGCLRAVPGVLHVPPVGPAATCLQVCGGAVMTAAACGMTCFVDVLGRAQARAQVGGSARAWHICLYSLPVAWWVREGYNRFEGGVNDDVWH
jgi:hypothetical protein